MDGENDIVVDLFPGATNRNLPGHELAEGPVFLLFHAHTFGKSNTRFFI